MNSNTFTLNTNSNTPTPTLGDAPINNLVTSTNDIEVSGQDAKLTIININNELIDNIATRTADMNENNSSSRNYQSIEDTYYADCVNAYNGNNITQVINMFNTIILTNKTVNMIPYMAKIAGLNTGYFYIFVSRTSNKYYTVDGNIHTFEPISLSEIIEMYTKYDTFCVTGPGAWIKIPQSTKQIKSQSKNANKLPEKITVLPNDGSNKTIDNNRKFEIVRYNKKFFVTYDKNNNLNDSVLSKYEGEFSEKFAELPQSNNAGFVAAYKNIASQNHVSNNINGLMELTSEFRYFRSYKHCLNCGQQTLLNRYYYCLQCTKSAFYYVEESMITCTNYMKECTSNNVKAKNNKHIAYGFSFYNNKKQPVNYCLLCTLPDKVYNRSLRSSKVHYNMLMSYIVARISPSTRGLFTVVSANSFLAYQNQAGETSKDIINNNKKQDVGNKQLSHNQMLKSSEGCFNDPNSNINLNNIYQPSAHDIENMKKTFNQYQIKNHNPFNVPSFNSNCHKVNVNNNTNKIIIPNNDDKYINNNKNNNIKKEDDHNNNKSIIQFNDNNNNNNNINNDSQVLIRGISSNNNIDNFNINNLGGLHNNNFSSNFSCNNNIRKIENVNNLSIEQITNLIDENQPYQDEISVVTTKSIQYTTNAKNTVTADIRKTVVAMFNTGLAAHQSNSTLPKVGFVAPLDVDVLNEKKTMRSNNAQLAYNIKSNRVPTSSVNYVSLLINHNCRENTLKVIPYRPATYNSTKINRHEGYAAMRNYTEGYAIASSSMYTETGTTDVLIYDMFGSARNLKRALSNMWVNRPCVVEEDKLRIEKCNLAITQLIKSTLTSNLQRKCYYCECKNITQCLKNCQAKWDIVINKYRRVVFLLNDVGYYIDKIDEFKNNIINEMPKTLDISFTEVFFQYPIGNADKNVGGNFKFNEGKYLNCQSSWVYQASSNTIVSRPADNTDAAAYTHPPHKYNNIKAAYIYDEASSILNKFIYRMSFNDSTVKVIMQSWRATKQHALAIQKQAVIESIPPQAVSTEILQLFDQLNKIDGDGTQGVVELTKNNNLLNNNTIIGNNSNCHNNDNNFNINRNAGNNNNGVDAALTNIIADEQLVKNMYANFDIDLTDPSSCADNKVYSIKKDKIDILYRVVPKSTIIKEQSLAFTTFKHSDPCNVLIDKYKQFKLDEVNDYIIPVRTVNEIVAKLGAAINNNKFDGDKESNKELENIYNQTLVNNVKSFNTDITYPLMIYTMAIAYRSALAIKTAKESKEYNDISVFTKLKRYMTPGEWCRQIAATTQRYAGVAIVGSATALALIYSMKCLYLSATSHILYAVPYATGLSWYAHLGIYAGAFMAREYIFYPARFWNFYNYLTNSSEHVNVIKSGDTTKTEYPIASINIADKLRESGSQRE